MRVIAGSLRGRKLVTPPGLDTRPTTDMVKEAICSAIQFDFPGASVLDLFAGSGQMGIEALSRGARRAVFVDSDRRAMDCVRQNLKTCGLTESSETFCGDSFAYLQRTAEVFDIAFLDPPYRNDILPKILPILVKKMSKNGIIVCEHEPECALPQSFLCFDLQKRKKYGKITVSFYRTPEEEP